MAVFWQQEVFKMPASIAGSRGDEAWDYYAGNRMP